jgi:hypothetical protein
VITAYKVLTLINPEEGISQHTSTHAACIQATMQLLNEHVGSHPACKQTMVLLAAHLLSHQHQYMSL